MTGRELLAYLPYLYREIAEYQGICAGEQPQIDAAWAAAAQCMDDQFIPSAGDYGLARWEAMLGISPAASDTLQTRRARILALLLREQNPYTLPWLRAWLEAQFGAGSVTAEVEDYTLWIEYLDPGDDPVGLTDAIAAALEEILPLNLRYGRILSTGMGGTTSANPTPVCTWQSTCLPYWDETVLGNFILGADSV